MAKMSQNKFTSRTSTISLRGIIQTVTKNHLREQITPHQMLTKMFNSFNSRILNRQSKTKTNINKTSCRNSCNRKLKTLYRWFRGRVPVMLTFKTMRMNIVLKI